MILTSDWISVKSIMSIYIGLQTFWTLPVLQVTLASEAFRLLPCQLKKLNDRCRRWSITLAPLRPRTCGNKCYRPTNREPLNLLTFSSVRWIRVVAYCLQKFSKKSCVCCILQMQNYRKRRLKESERKLMYLEHHINLNIDNVSLEKRYISDNIGLY